MSSDCFYITIKEIKDDRITLRARTTLAGGLNDQCYTRSFILIILVDARRRTRYKLEGVSNKLTALEKEAESFPEICEDWYVDENFMKNNVHRYIKSTKVIKRRNHLIESDVPAILELQDQLSENNELTPYQKEEKLCEKMHYIEVEVVMTDPKFLEGLDTGWVFGTTAYDVWWGDPTNPYYN